MKIFKLFLLIIISLTFSSQVFSEDKILKSLKEGGKIIFIRHAYAPGGGDPENFNINDCSTQRNLNDEGISQSKLIGEFFKAKKIKIDKVLSSEWCRCKDTAKYAFGNFKEFSALNSTYTPPYDQNEKHQIKDLKKYVNNWNGKGGNLVLVTHYVIILAITGETTRSGEIVITDKNFKVLSRINTF